MFRKECTLYILPPLPNEKQKQKMSTEGIVDNMHKFQVVNPFILKNKERMVVFLDHLSSVREKPYPDEDRVKGDPARWESLFLAPAVEYFHSGIWPLFIISVMDILRSWMTSAKRTWCKSKPLSQSLKCSPSTSRSTQVRGHPAICREWNVDTLIAEMLASSS